MKTTEVTIVCWARWDGFNSRIAYSWVDNPDTDMSTEGWFRVGEVVAAPIEFSHAAAVAHFTAAGRLKQHEIERIAAEKIADIEQAITTMACLTYSGDTK